MRVTYVPIWLCAVLLVACFSAVPSSHAAWTGSGEDFVDMVQQHEWAFFRDHQNAVNGMWRAGGYNTNLTYDPWSCTAGNGFGMAATVVAAYRGWISDAEAYNRIVPLLRTYSSVQKGANGFFRHFYNYSSAEPMSGIETSDIDSAWFVCGALLAAEYFKGTEIDQLANAHYQAMTFDTDFDPWYWWYCEYQILNILGAGSPTHPLSHPTNTAWAWNTMMNPVSTGPLFWHQWPQAFVDYRYRPDGRGTNFFNTITNCTRDQRQRCIDLHNAEPFKYDDYGTNCWGLTAAFASTNYLAMNPFSGEEMCDSGSVCPMALPSSMPHLPSEVRDAMIYIYNSYTSFPCFSTYGFMGVFNTATANCGSAYYWHQVPAADAGCPVVAIENYRSGVPWKYFMRNPNVQTGMDRLGMTQSIWVPYHDDFNDGTDPNSWGGSISLTNSDGSNPTAVYELIPYVNEWVRSNAVKMVANGTGDIVRTGLNGADQGSTDVLSFWLRGNSGGESFRVGLRDSEGREVTVPISPYVPGGSVPTNWCRVRIPLRPFNVTGSPTNDVRINALGDFSVQFNQAGTIWIEDLAFVMDDIEPDLPATFGAACIDGRVYMRWPASTHSDVVGYQLWRRSTPTSSFVKARSSLVSYQTNHIDATFESQWGQTVRYAIQAVDRNQNTSSFSSDAYEQCVLVGRHRDLDYGDGQNPHTFGADHGAWGTGASHTFELREVAGGGTGWVRRVAGGASGSGAYVYLNSGSLGAYDAVSFWVRGEAGNEQVEFGLKSTNWVERKVPLSRYLPGGAVSTSWAQVRIPFLDFKGVDFAKMDNISFTFLASGAILVDDVRFERLSHEGEVWLVKEGEEADAFAGGDTNDFKWAASQSRVLGNNWATNAGDYARFNFDAASDINEAYLEVRYACNLGTGRVLSVLVNSTNRGSLAVTNTLGWGEEASHFAEPALRLGKIDAGAFTLELKALVAGTAVNLDRVIVRGVTNYFREAEHYDAQSGADYPDYKPGASGGQVLGWNWGMDNGDYAAYSNIVLGSTVSGAVLRIRYGQAYGDGRLLRVYLDGTNMGQIAVSFTDGWLDFYAQGGCSELPLGTIRPGTHTLRLQAEGSNDAINLDWISIVGRLDTVREYDTDGDGIPDCQELLYGTSTNAADEDGDGLNDLQEISRVRGYLTNPHLANTDGDYLDDGQEFIAGTDPTDSNTVFEIFSGDYRTPSSAKFVLTWPGREECSYDIQYMDGGPGGTGTYVSVTDPGDRSVSNSIVTYVDDGSGTTPAPASSSLQRRVYRIRAYAP